MLVFYDQINTTTATMTPAMRCYASRACLLFSCPLQSLEQTIANNYGYYGAIKRPQSKGNALKENISLSLSRVRLLALFSLFMGDN